MPRPTWRYTTGVKGVNRVTVYERKDRCVLYIEYHRGSGERVQRAIQSHTGAALPNTKEGRELAVRVAEAVAQERETLRYREVGHAYGVATDRTVPQLLKRLHADKVDRWSKTYRKDTARFRKFWEMKLGAVRLHEVSAALVERVAAEEAKRRGWSPRTHGSYLRYVVDAFGYAERKLKWIGAKDNLSAVDIPSPRSASLSYSRDEVKRKLLPALEQVDSRAAWIGQVAWQTGRRLSAIRHVKKKHVVISGDTTVIHFPKETDKVGREGRAAVVDRATKLTAELMERPGTYVLGKKPPTLKRCDLWLRDAEKRAGITHITGRSWHAIKRRWATETKGEPGRRGQAGTDEGTLDRVYVQDDLAPQVALATRLAKEVE